MVFANKSDMPEEEIQVSKEEIKQWSEDHKIPVIYTSAKTGENVDDSFLDITKRLIVRKNAEGSSGQNKQRQMGLALKKLQLKDQK